MNESRASNDYEQELARRFADADTVERFAEIEAEMHRLDTPARKRVAEMGLRRMGITPRW